MKQPAPYLLVPSHKSFLWPIFTETQPDGSPPGTRLRRTLVNSQPHLNCLEVFDGILFSQKLYLLPPALSHATWCGEATSQDISCLSCLTSFPLPTNFSHYTFPFPAFPMAQFQAGSIPLLISELQRHWGDAGPGGKWGMGRELPAANKEKRLISMSLLSSSCLLREGPLVASPSHQWSSSSLVVLIPFSFCANNIKTEESNLLLSQGKGGLSLGW